MTALLLRLFVPHYRETDKREVRERYGALSGAVGIFVNLLLCAGKFLAGAILGSVSIRADAVNNLSDAGSSLVSLVSFRISSKPADREHPYGHARMEYIASMIISFIILHIGLDILGEALERILHPEKSTLSLFGAGVLVFSIAAKLWLWRFNSSLGRRIDSDTLKATAADSFSDVLSTSAVLLSALIGHFTNLATDGWMGLIVGVLVLLSGVKIAREAADNLLGRSPDPEMVGRIRKYALEHYPEVLGIHDMMLHCYGPGQYFVSFHAEVDGSADIFVTHDAIDNLERALSREFGLHCSIHMDPIVVGDPLTDDIREHVRDIVSEVEPSLTIHDFRMVVGNTHSNLIFDIAVPFECKRSPAELEAAIRERIRAWNPTYYAVMTFDQV